MISNFNDNLKPTRPGFTLVELLFVIAIIAVLGALATGILGKARADAQVAATRSRITQIEAIMQTVMEDFEVRRIPVRLTGDPIQVRNNRRQIIAAMMLAEYPSADADKATLGQLNVTIPGLTISETAEMLHWQSQAGNEDLDQPGEFLSLILSRIDIDGISALESLGPNVVGDPDGDGLLDIVDAFGDSMALRIFQEDASGLLMPLNPMTTPPPAINEIRFLVTSPNLEEIDPTLGLPAP